MTKKTTLEMARENVARLENYLSQTDALPLHGGTVNATAVATACGFDRQILYKNTTCRALLGEAARKQGVTFIATMSTENEDQSAPEAMVSAAKLREEQRRVGALEKRLSEMIIRNAALSARLRQHTLIEEELIASGRRSRPPGAAPLFDQEVKD